MIKKSTYSMLILFFLTILYALVFYLVFTDRIVTDFAPFYRSSLALGASPNPYMVLDKVSANLNPPIFLILLKPLTYFGFRSALLLWLIISISLGLIAVKLAFQIIFTKDFVQKNWINLYLIYFAFYPTLMDILIAQFGEILFFFIIIGYHYYLKNCEKLAGLFWGVIISIKFFPALLFFYVYKQQRMQVFKMMLFTAFVCCLIPLFMYSPRIYVNYFSMLSNVLWYGDSWNASLYGFLFRQLINTRLNIHHDLILIEILFFCLFILFLIIYYLALGSKKNAPINHQPFCLTLVMMLLLSPFGWLYYFPLLLFPIVLTFFAAFDKKKSGMYAAYYWVFCFFLTDYPQTYISSKKMPVTLHRIGLFSFHFYALLLLTAFLIYWQKIYSSPVFNLKDIMSDDKKQRCFYAIIIIVAYGLTVPLNSYLSRFIISNGG